MSNRRPQALFLTLVGLLAVASSAQVAAADTAQLDVAMAPLHGSDWGKSANSLPALEEAAAATQGDAAARQHLERRLIALLQTNTSVAVKQFVCRQLSLIGTPDSIPALEALLLEPDLSHMARFALERMADARAAAALRRALPSATGKVKVGIISSLGRSADPQATSALAGLLSDPDASVAGAAVSALGRIGTSEAARALERFRPTAPKVLQPLVMEAYATAADTLLRQSQRAEAARIFHLLEAEESADTLRWTAFRGLLAAEPEQAVARLSQALASDQEARRALAARVLVELAGDHALKPYLELLPSLPAAGQVAVLEAVYARQDRSARPAVLPACNHSAPRVRLAALRALSVTGTAEDVPQLARLAAADGGEESAVARQALANLPGRDTSASILAMLSGAPPRLRVELIQALAARGASEAAPSLARQLDDAEDVLRLALLEAIASLGDCQQAPAVIAALRRAGDDPTRRAAEKALGALVTRSGVRCLEALLSGLDRTGAPARIVLLRQLGRLGGKEALEAVRAAVSGGVGPLSDAAFGVLADWPDAGALPDLLESVRKPDPPGRRALAFRGYVRLCRESYQTPDERLGSLKQAMALATGADEQLLVTAALAEVADPGALNVLATCLEDPALVDAASVAVVKVASALDPSRKAESIAALKQALARCKNPGIQQQVEGLLNKLGAAAE
jgi:HEAT repeat protein